MSIKLHDKITGDQIDPAEIADELMLDAGLDPHMRYEDVGIQSDGTIVVFDKCGKFGYLDGTRYFFKTID